MRKDPPHHRISLRSLLITTDKIVGKTRTPDVIMDRLTSVVHVETIQTYLLSNLPLSIGNNF